MLTKPFNILFLLSILLVFSSNALAQDLPTTRSKIPPKTVDSLKIQTVDTALIPPPQVLDSTLTDSIPVKKEFLTDIVNYKADDYTYFNLKEQRLYLYNKAEVIYGDLEIKAGIIVVDYNKNEVYAGRIKDSLGDYTQHPIFKQGDNVIEPDSIRFNFDTEKALIYNTKTEQNSFYITAPITKKENDSVVFMYKARFTTSKNLENPEYYFQSSKIKLVPKQKIIVGPTNMVIADVPTPIGVPFGFFPLTSKQTSGIIFPTFGEQNDRGYFIQNGGYYFAISDYADLAVLGDIYTNGSYGFRLENSYAKRYKFNGLTSFRYENLISQERGFPNYSKTTIYNIRWTHSQDSKANPNSRFSASVNLGSTNYYRESTNQINTPNFLNNALSSSISYSKAFQGEPQVNVSLTATHSQNTNTEQINMTLPTLQASVSRIFPFAPKNGIKKGVFQNINFQYNLRGENRIQTTDSLFFKKEMFDDARTGLQHTIPISTNFKLFNYLSFSAGTNFNETWVFKTIERSYNQTTDQVITTEINGFDAYRTYSFSASLGTTVYGQFNFKTKENDPKIHAIRHVMRPSISYSLSPSFDQFYDTYEVIDANGTTLEEYSRFEESIFGAPTNMKSSSIGLSLSNNLEAKIRSKDSTATEPEKITIFNNLNFSTNYNITADSLQWSPLRISGGTQILNNKMNINFGMTLDPYALDNNNRKIDEFNINNGGSLFRLTSANLTMSYSLSNESFSEDKEKAKEKSREENLLSGGRDDDLFGRAQDFSNQGAFDEDTNSKTEDDIEHYNYSIPWSLNLAYTVNYSNSARQNEIGSQSLMFSGDVEFSPRWSVGASSGYDFKGKGFTYTQFRFERDLLSWRMSFNWVPFSERSSWYFFIGIKSSILSDIKYEKRRRPDEQL